MKTVIVIPTYNEASNVAEVFRRVFEAAPEADILMMDDNSPDGTADLAEQLARENASYARYRVVRRTGKHGLGRAYLDGFDRAIREGYDRVVQMDADLSHDPAFIPDMIAVSRRYDLVIGSRYCAGGGVRNWPLRRRMLSKFAVRYVQTIAAIPFADATAGFRCWTQAGLKALQLQTLRSEGYSFQVEMSYRAFRAGLRTVEIPIIFTDRQHGKSKISRGVLLESMMLPWKLRLRSWIPLAEDLEIVPLTRGR